METAGRSPLALIEQEAPQVVRGDVLDPDHIVSLQKGHMLSTPVEN